MAKKFEGSNQITKIPTLITNRISAINDIQKVNALTAHISQISHETHPNPFSKESNGSVRNGLLKTKNFILKLQF